MFLYLLFLIGLNLIAFLLHHCLSFTYFAELEFLKGELDQYL